MAKGLFGAMPSVEGVRGRKQAELTQKLIDAQQASLDKAFAGANTPEAQIGSGVGFLLGQGARSLFGGGQPSVEEQVNADPDVQEAQRSMELAAEMQGITQGEEGAAPGTAEFYRRAANLAHNRGRSGMALQLGEQAQRASMAEAEMATQQQAAAVKQAREAWKTQDVETRQRMIVEDPTVLNTIAGGNYDEEQLGNIQAGTKASLETKMLIAQHKSDQVKAAQQPQTSKIDLSAVNTRLSNRGYGGHSFEKSFGRDNPAAYEELVLDSAEFVDALRAKWAQAGNTITQGQAFQVLDQMLELVSTGDKDDITNVDIEKLEKLKQEALNFDLKATEAPKAPPSKPAETVDFDFTAP